MKLARTLPIAAASLAATAAIVAASARSTERRHPPAGSFLDIDGIAIHYLERGEGPPVVLLHGNGVTAEDWVVSGIFDALARSHRVIAIDRPGFGYSDRPRDRAWTPVEQAELLHRIFADLGITAPVVVAHSWATLVALALALDHPADTARIVLLSGYYFPTARVDALLLGGPALPLVGDVLRYTISPVAGRLAAPALVKKLFAPAPVDERFAQGFPLSMSLRPAQLRASAMEAVMMPAAAGALEDRYGALSVPVSVIAGDGDEVADPIAQSERLARLLGVRAELVPGAGHMVHYFAPERVIAAVENAATPPEQRLPSG